MFVCGGFVCVWCLSLGGDLWLIALDDWFVVACVSCFVLLCGFG